MRHVAEGHATELTAWKRSKLAWDQTPGEASILSGPCVIGNGQGKYVQLGQEDRITFNDKGKMFKTLPFSEVAHPCDLWEELNPCTKEGVPLSDHHLGRRQWSQAPPLGTSNSNRQSRPRR
jgi:hypothetical protein